MIRSKDMKKILIVENEAVIALRLQQMLVKMGYDVIGISYTGKEALESARSLGPDLILMDIMIPGELDGIAVAETVKSELDIPVIFLTAFSEDQIIERAKKVEPLGYILKPFQDNEIKAVIEVAFYKNEMEEKLQKAHDDLDRRVKERTAELHDALKTVKRNEAELTQSKLALEKINIELLETNQALSILARNIDKDKELFEKNIYQTIQTKIMPIINKLQNDEIFRNRQVDLDVLETYLNKLTSGSTQNQGIDTALSDQEMRVAIMIKNGLSSQQIADMLNISLHTVKTHRKNIRKKLNIQNSNVNLTTYLKSKFK